MEYFLTIKALREARLTPDWQTIYVGWREPLFDDCVPLSVETVQQYAAECLTGNTDTDYPLIRILDAGTSKQELQHEEGYISALAARSGVSKTMALRKWRYVTALTVPLEMPKRTIHPQDLEQEWAEDIWYWEWFSDGRDFWRAWANIALEPQLPHWENQQRVEDYINPFRQWLDEEKTALNASV